MFSAAFTAMVALAASSPAADHLFNARRTGYVPREFKPPYHRVWTHAARHKPRPAWREPAWETQRIDFDYAHALSAGNGLVYVALSGEHAVDALNLASGELRWRFFTEGPVRLAPAVSAGKVFFSCDDGWARCLDGRTGTLVWRYRPQIPDERLIGNEQMISRWPGRSGVLVVGKRAYTTFGMWSPEGIVVTCIDAENGTPIWENDGAGTHYMTQPHYEAMGGVSPQGYLAMCGDVLVVTCGRATPAFFDAGTGKLLYNESEGLFPGGAWTMTHGDLAFTPCELLQKPNSVKPAGPEADVDPNACLVGIRARTGEEVFHLKGALQGVIDDAGILNLVGPKKLLSVALDDVLKAAPAGQARLGSSEGQFVEAAKHARWETQVERVYELIQSGSTLIAGGRGTLSCYDAVNGRKTWETGMAGDVRELLIAGDCLLVGTTEGETHCYRRGTDGQARTTRIESRAIGVPADLQDRVAAVLSGAGVARGYGLLLGEFSVEQLAAYAGQSPVQWHWAAGDRGADTLRRRLAGAGLHGTRVAIHHVATDPLPYTDYFADVVVSRVVSPADLNGTKASELHRVLRPCGGVAVVTFPGGLRPKVEQWLDEGGVPAVERRRLDIGLRIERGPLAGAGSWTHQYADAGKSGASKDVLVRLPLKTLWYGGVGPSDIVSRHYRTPAPLAIDGRVFMPGMDYVHAMDAYNGRILWERHLPGVGRWPAPYRGGSVVVDSEAVYALQERRCLRLDPRTGETISSYSIPGQVTDAEAIWEYLAVVGDTVLGTLGNPHVKPTWWSYATPVNERLFALDRKTGKAKWTHDSSDGIDTTAIAVEGERIFVIDGLGQYELFSQPSARTGKLAPKPGRVRTLYRTPEASRPRVLKALELGTGRELWRTEKVGASQNNLWAANGVILATTPLTTGKPVRLKAKGAALSAFSAEDGSLLWEHATRVKSPVIIGDVVYLPRPLKLRTGKPVHRPDPVTRIPGPFHPAAPGGCGRLAGCPNVLMKRSGSLGFFDLRQRGGVYHYPNVRASCWVNMVPAAGLVLVPEGSSSCPCAYNYKTSLALMPATRHNHWGLYGTPPGRKHGRLQELRLNFGAPGDKLEKDGSVWFAYPRPSTTGPRGGGGMGKQSIMPVPVEMSGDASDLSTRRRNPDGFAMEGTDRPWLYSCSLSGPLSLRISLGPGGLIDKTYRVAIHIGEHRDGEAIYEVKLQGKTVPGEARVLRSTVKAASVITVEFVPKGDAPSAICGLEIEAAE